MAPTQPNPPTSEVLLDGAVPAEIFLEPEQAARRRAQVKHDGNVYTVPRLRIIGFSLIALVGVPLHNMLVTHNFSFSTFFTFFIAVELYCTATWLLLYSYYDRVKRIDLGDFFLYTDIFVLAGAVYVTGGDQSWFFWLPLMRVFDQAVYGFKRSMSFNVVATAIFFGLWFYMWAIEQRPMDINREIAKTLFVGTAGFYIALTSGATADLRTKLVSTIRFARHAIAQLKESGYALIEARRSAEQASQAKSEFMARVSHELRRPATTVIGFAQLLEMGELHAKQRDYAARILRAGQDLGIMIDEVMDLADVQSGHVTLTDGEVALAEIVEDALTHVWPLAAARSVRLISTEDANRDAVRVIGDPRALHRVVLNTVAHVVRYSAVDDRVVVSWHREGDYARITVRDSGPGILSAPVEEILSSAARPEEEVSRMQELGLGLAFAKSLIIAMNGRVGADLEIGEGTTYWIDLPLAPSVANTRPLAAAAHRA
jgi:signal transduction histidine kinase